MASPHLETFHLDVAIGAYTACLRGLLESPEITQTRVNELRARHEVMRNGLSQVALILAQMPATPGTRRALRQLDAFLESSEEALIALEALSTGDRDARACLVAQERIATQILDGLNAAIARGTLPAHPSAETTLAGQRPSGRGCVAA
ncbi:MAG: hypothetical protein IRZ16_19710 [Myxococcaceae bacterium]|nr:hypothetical protein [Myxococcaceae bacterium]